MHPSSKHISSLYVAIENHMKLRGVEGDKIKGQERGRERRKSGGGREKWKERENKPLLFY